MKALIAGIVTMSVNKRFAVMLATIGIALVLGPQARAGSTIFDTTPEWNGSQYINSFGNPNTATYGETFIAPTNNVLQSFTFYIEGSAGDVASMKAYVFAWTGSLFGGNGPQGAVGPALYASPSSIVLTADGNFDPVTVTTGGTTLTAGDQYVILLTVSNPSDFNATTGQFLWGLASSQNGLPNDGGGGFNFFNNGSDFGEINNGQWDDFENFGDLAFKATFTSASIPEPSSGVVLGVGVVGLLGYGRARRGRRRAA
jgi:hypothetical protein